MRAMPARARRSSAWTARRSCGRHRAPRKLGWRGLVWRLVRRVRLTALVLVMALAAAWPPSRASADPVEVRPGWENAPWEGKAQTILNVTAQIGLACCVLSLLLGGAAMGVGRIIGSYQAGNRGLQLILGGGGGALVIASAASIVSWLIT